jgi:amino acid transporter
VLRRLPFPACRSCERAYHPFAGVQNRTSSAGRADLQLSDALDAAVSADHSDPLDKGLKAGALGFMSSVVIGVASTAPAYSLAATLGFVTAVVGVGYQAPIIMVLAFVPMLFVALGFKYLNQADPDCGTTFTWCARAFGPITGWLGGWGLIFADVLVMASLSQIAGAYTFDLFGMTSEANSKLWVGVAGVIWILLMGAICYVGIEASARTQWGLLGAEIVILVIFSVVALTKVWTGHAPGGVHPSLSWLNPFDIKSFGAMSSGLLLAIFIYWGWDTAVSVNEETSDATETPGRAAVVSTFLLLAIYLLVTIAAQSFHGINFLNNNSGDVLGALGKDVLGSPWDKLLIIAVLTSASASTQTTILPTTRATLSMASHGALPKQFGKIHPRYLTPSASTIWMCAVSIVVFVLLNTVSSNILEDSVTSTGFGIAFYYGLTGVACTWFFRKQLFQSARNFFLVGLLPLVGGIILFAILGDSAYQAWNPANSSTGSTWLGISVPLAMALFGLAIGVVILIGQRIVSPEPFFSWKTEIADPAVLDGPGPEAAHG